MLAPPVLASFLLLANVGAPTALAPSADVVIVPGSAISGRAIPGQLRVQISGLTGPLELSVRVLLIAGTDAGRASAIRDSRTLPLDVESNGTHVYDLARHFPLVPPANGDYTLLATVALLEGGGALGGSPKASSRIRVGPPGASSLLSVNLSVKPEASAGQPVRGYVVVGVGDTGSSGPVDVALQVSIESQGGGDSNAMFLGARRPGSSTKVPLSIDAPVLLPRSGSATVVATASAVVGGRVHTATARSLVQVTGERTDVYLEPETPLIVFDSSPVRVGTSTKVVAGYRIVNRSAQAVQATVHGRLSKPGVGTIAQRSDDVSVPPGGFRALRMDGVVRPTTAGVHCLRASYSGGGVGDFDVWRQHCFAVEGPSAGGVGGRFEVQDIQTTATSQTLDTPLANAPFDVALTYRIQPNGPQARWMMRSFATLPGGRVISRAEPQEWRADASGYRATLTRTWRTGVSVPFHQPGTCTIRIVMEGEGFETWERTFTFTLTQKK
jgi:hypothetical protein